MNRDTRSIRVAVVGGGVAGLSAAYRLLKELRTAGVDHDIVLYEQQDACGGAARTSQVDGFSLDHGPNGWLSNEPLTARLIDELGLTGELIEANDNARHRFVYTRNKLRRLPDSPGKFLTTGILQPWEKLRVLREYLIPARHDDNDETIFDFGCRRLGRGFTDSMLDPMVSGIFAGDIHQLSLPATFPRMRSMELEHGGLFKAMFAKQRARKKGTHAGQGGGPAGPAGVLTTLRGGVGRLTEMLSRELAAIIQVNRPISSLTRQADGFELWCGGTKEQFDAVVLATPAHQTAGIIGQLAPHTAQSLEQIDFAGTVVVCHVYDAKTLPKQLNGFGHLIPRRDGVRALGCLWTSCIFPDQAPTGKVLLRTIFGGAHDPGILDFSDDQLIELVVESTATTLGIVGAPVKSWIFRHPLGIAQYTLGHRQRVAEIEKLCDAIPGLAFVGASYRGVSLNRCIRDAYTVAPRVLRPSGVNVPTIADGNAKPETV